MRTFQTKQKAIQVHASSLYRNHQVTLIVRFLKPCPKQTDILLKARDNIREIRLLGMKIGVLDFSVDVGFFSINILTNPQSLTDGYPLGDIRVERGDIDEMFGADHRFGKLQPRSFIIPDSFSYTNFLPDGKRSLFVQLRSLAFCHSFRIVTPVHHQKAEMCRFTFPNPFAFIEYASFMVHSRKRAKNQPATKRPRK